VVHGACHCLNVGVQALAGCVQEVVGGDVLPSWSGRSWGKIAVGPSLLIHGGGSDEDVDAVGIFQAMVRSTRRRRKRRRSGMRAGESGGMLEESGVEPITGASQDEARKRTPMRQRSDVGVEPELRR